jgi:hypothetical protein
MLFIGGPQGNGIQNSILFFVSFAFVFSMRGEKYAPRLAFSIALCLGVISLIPTPVYPGNFSLCIPFLLVSAVCVIHDLVASSDAQGKGLVGVGIWVALLAIYLGVSIPDFRKYLITGKGIASVSRAENKDDWRLSEVLKVSQALDEVTTPGETVASFWPGYVFQTQTRPFLGLENDFALPVSEKLTAEQRLLYHIISPQDIERNFAAHQPRVVVLGNENLYLKAAAAHAKMVLLADGYAQVRLIGDTAIYVCRSKP